MAFLFGLIAFLGGIFNSIASGSNSSLNKSLGQPVVAALIITTINAVLYVSIIPIVGIAVPKAAAITEVPWWAWMGGLLGGFYALASIFFAEKLGAALFHRPQRDG